MTKTILFAFFMFFQCVSAAQPGIECYPTHWWAGMKSRDVQLMIHYDNIAADASVSLSYPGVRLIKTNKVENPNYLFLDLSISAAAKPGKINITIVQKSAKQVIAFELKQRRNGNGTAYAQGVRSSDFIYLLMPDRFSNGDPGNDRIAGLRDQSLNRDSIFLRHGGDLQGVINHLDYLKDLGVTALWLTPVLQNDMPNRTEHGYAFTNHYKIEPRLGGESAYKLLSDQLHANGMKLIQDAVYNHVGLFHFTVQDLPMKDWLHQWPTFTKPNYKDQTLFDPYVAAIDKKIMTDGWFTSEMPDLNQSNPFVARYLIQHAIWCVEEFGLDGWRIDTYIYLDLEFMNRCNKALTDEFPNLTLFGEAWVTGTANEAFFTKNNINTSFKSNLMGVTDFQSLFAGILPAINDKSPDKLYQTLSNDFLYADATRNVIFLDNHDMTRFFSQTGENIRKHKMGISWLLTCRGIPQMYYGTEVLMKGVSNPDGWVRLDFPGGWEGDKKNAFTKQGLSEQELEVLDFTKALAKFRMNSSALTIGKLMHYVPEDGVYVYFRYTSKQTIMCVMNTNDNEREVGTERFSERMKGFTQARNVIDGSILNVTRSFTVPSQTLLVVELLK
ncbi:MAG: alpha-amylase family glycosyl hydrolase [Chitinophagaceae bacterium]